MDFEGGYEEFVCHRDSSGILYVNPSLNIDCDSLVGFSPLSINSKNPLSDGIVIYPNPARDYVNIDFVVENKGYKNHVLVKNL